MEMKGGLGVCRTLHGLVSTTYRWVCWKCRSSRHSAFCSDEWDCVRIRALVIIIWWKCLLQWWWGGNLISWWAQHRNRIRSREYDLIDLRPHFVHWAQLDQCPASGYELISTTSIFEYGLEYFGSDCPIKTCIPNSYTRNTLYWRVIWSIWPIPTHTWSNSVQPCPGLTGSSLIHVVDCEYISGILPQYKKWVLCMVLNQNLCLS